MTRPLAIDLYSDVVCPWCWVGKRRLERVLREQPEVQATIRWRPFRLRPDLPPEGEDWREIIETKFGGAERAAMMFARVAEAGRTEGIDFAFDRITRSPNTMDARLGVSGAQPPEVFREAIRRALLL